MKTIIKIIKKILRIESPSIVLMSDNKKKGKERKIKMIKKIVSLTMRSFVKLYFKLDKECDCYCIGTNDDDDDFDIHRRRYKP